MFCFLSSRCYQIEGCSVVLYLLCTQPKVKAGKRYSEYQSSQEKRQRILDLESAANLFSLIISLGGSSWSKRQTQQSRRLLEGILTYNKMVFHQEGALFELDCHI
ncbi:hypothetical protein FGO68_gene2081 [Halteria grandinella]|uniref:Uncharacterized protein n=1 Tax=Halteria grandinella TaxID=5974 RepID=A0A8J8SW49_HALGN|nr:hypothetical protein FGO68_gene2081 [Halteria grandinella]